MPATEKPRAEPEIIPPGDLDGRLMRDRYHFDVHGGSQRIYVTRLGPFGIVVLGLLIALIAAVIPIVLLGARRSSDPRNHRDYCGQRHEGHAHSRNGDWRADDASGGRRRHLDNREGFHQAFYFGWNAS